MGLRKEVTEGGASDRQTDRERQRERALNHTKHTLYGQNAEFYHVKADGIHNNHWSLKG
jgi:hypothetical protein